MELTQKEKDKIYRDNNKERIAATKKRCYDKK